MTVSTQKNLEEKVIKFEEKLASVTDNEKELYKYQIHSKYVHSKLTELEDRSRRSNVRMYGIAHS